jgi:hypothetical protein
MIVMRMMQVAFYQVVDMVPMRHPIMAAIGTMNVPFVVTAAGMLICASVGVRCVHLKHVLIDMIPVHMVQVPVMQVVDVPVMADRLMPAVWPVPVSVAGMLLAFVHHNSSTDKCVPRGRLRTSRQRRLSGVHGIAFQAKRKTVLRRNAPRDANPSKAAPHCHFWRPPTSRKRLSAQWKLAFGGSRGEEQEEAETKHSDGSRKGEGLILLENLVGVHPR